MNKNKATQTGNHFDFFIFLLGWLNIQIFSLLDIFIVDLDVITDEIK